VVGLTLQEARNVLLSHRLITGAVSFDEPEQEGVPQYVYSQTPNAGTSIIEGETVALRLSTDIEKAARSTTSNTETDEDEFF